MDEATAMLVTGTVMAAFPSRQWPEETIALWVRALGEKVIGEVILEAAVGPGERAVPAQVPSAVFDRAAFDLVCEPGEHPPALGDVVKEMRRARREWIERQELRLEAVMIEEYEAIAVPPPRPLAELVAAATPERIPG